MAMTYRKSLGYFDLWCQKRGSKLEYTHNVGVEPGEAEAGAAGVPRRSGTVDPRKIRRSGEEA